jgi:WD40 repeat protein
LTFSSDGKLLAAGCADGTVRIWDVENWNESCTLIGHSMEVLSVGFSPNNQFILTGSLDGSCRIWNLKTKTQQLNVIERPQLATNGRPLPVWSAAFSPDGSKIVSAGSDECVRLWNVESGRQEKILGTYPGGLRAVLFGADRSFLAIRTNDGDIRIIDFLKSVEIKRLETGGGALGDRSYAICLGSGGRILAANNNNGKLRFWETSTWQEQEPLDARTGGPWLSAFGFSSDGIAATAELGSSEFKIWDVKSSSLLSRRRMGWLWLAISCMTFSPDGSKLATGLNNGTIEIWNVRELIR